MSEAGKWICANNEKITIEEIVRTIDDNLMKKVSFVQIIADNCGGSGQFERLKAKLTDGSLKIQNFSTIFYETTSFYW